MMSFCCRLYFNSHPHEEDDEAAAQARHIAEEFQLTSSRRGWHRRCQALQTSYISTHILTKRMTVAVSSVGVMNSISTHILTKRMTKVRNSLQITERNFNSHPHEEDDAGDKERLAYESWYFNSHPHEEDDWRIRRRRRICGISTHILTKRMTVICDKIIADIPFQLTSSRRGWHFRDNWTRWMWYFNSHPHEEDDWFIRISYGLAWYFNSHPHEEDDDKFQAWIE